MPQDETCGNCDGTGYIITCPDDLCATSARCMHGDGEQVCPECYGEGCFPLNRDWGECGEEEPGP